jgi:hypothetical protein
MKNIVLFVSILALVNGTVEAKPTALKGSMPNIILVLTDDQGMGDLSCMENPRLRTPHIDSFYEKSTRFTDFHVSPTCSTTIIERAGIRIHSLSGLDHRGVSI